MDKMQHALENNPDLVMDAMWCILADGDGLTPESQIETIKDMLLRFGERTDKRPFCPDCGEVMVKTHIETEDGGWITGWLCGCKKEG